MISRPHPYRIGDSDEYPVRWVRFALIGPKMGFTGSATPHPVGIALQFPDTTKYECLMPPEAPTAFDFIVKTINDASYPFSNGMLDLSIHCDAIKKSPSEVPFWRIALSAKQMTDDGPKNHTLLELDYSGVIGKTMHTIMESAYSCIMHGRQGQPPMWRCMKIMPTKRRVWIIDQNRTKQYGTNLTAYKTTTSIIFPVLRHVVQGPEVASSAGAVVAQSA